MKDWLEPTIMVEWATGGNTHPTQSTMNPFASRVGHCGRAACIDKTGPPVYTCVAG